MSSRGQENPSSSAVHVGPPTPERRSRRLVEKGDEAVFDLHRLGCDANPRGDPGRAAPRWKRSHDLDPRVGEVHPAQACVDARRSGQAQDPDLLDDGGHLGGGDGMPARSQDLELQVVEVDRPFGTPIGERGEVDGVGSIRIASRRQRESPADASPGHRNPRVDSSQEGREIHLARRDASIEPKLFDVDQPRQGQCCVGSGQLCLDRESLIRRGVRCRPGEGDLERLSFASRDEDPGPLQTQVSQAPGGLSSSSAKLEIRCEEGREVGIHVPRLGPLQVDPRVEDRHPLDQQRPCGEGRAFRGFGWGLAQRLGICGPDLEGRLRDAQLREHHAPARQLGQADGCQQALAAQRAERASRRRGEGEVLDRDLLTHQGHVDATDLHTALCNHLLERPRQDLPLQEREEPCDRCRGQGDPEQQTRDAKSLDLAGRRIGAGGRGHDPLPGGYRFHRCVAEGTVPVNCT